MKHALSELSRQINAKEFVIFEFETSLANFVDTFSVQSIRPLLTLFRDDHEYEEAFFSIVHAIESFEDAEYCREIILGINILQNASEHWLALILQRISNNPACYSSFCDYASATTDTAAIDALKRAVLIMRKNSPDSNWQRISSDLKRDLK